jgi:hypothetical protein
VAVLATRARGNGRGFFTGLILGLLVAACVAVALAFLFPPARFFPPRVDPGADVTPSAPAAPSDVTPPASTRAGTLLPPPALTPLVPKTPAGAMPADLPGLAPPAAPDVFDGGEAGSPSLFPQ